MIISLAKKELLFEAVNTRKSEARKWLKASSRSYISRVVCVRARGPCVHVFVYRQKRKSRSYIQQPLARWVHAHNIYIYIYIYFYYI